MSSKTIILSSAGLQNISQNGNYSDRFEFIFGNKKLVTNFLFADFISPLVSKMHISDATINNIDFTDYIEGLSITDEDISLIQLLSQGSSIEIDDNQISKIQMISLLLDNKELLNIINDQTEPKIDGRNIDEWISKLNLCCRAPNGSDIADSSSIINSISSNFYTINQNKLLSLPLRIVHSIISNENLVIESEDSLFDFIQKLFSSRKGVKSEEKEFDIASFFEEVEFGMLTDNKFREFIESFPVSEMTENLWRRLQKCFPASIEKGKSCHKESRYLFKGTIECKEGIINYLTLKSGGNVADKGTVNVTSSSHYNSFCLPRNAVDLQNAKNYFRSNDEPCCWLQYDFNEKMINPASYAIRTRHDLDGNHPRNWVIEGSNTGNEWTILDRRVNDTSLNGKSATHIFSIQSPSKREEGYRYLRMRLTGSDSSSHFYLTVSSLEYFGALFNS